MPFIHINTITTLSRLFDWLPLHSESIDAHSNPSSSSTASLVFELSFSTFASLVLKLSVSSIVNTLRIKDEGVALLPMFVVSSPPSSKVREPSSNSFVAPLICEYAWMSYCWHFLISYVSLSSALSWMACEIHFQMARCDEWCERRRENNENSSKPKALSALLSLPKVAFDSPWSTGTCTGTGAVVLIEWLLSLYSKLIDGHGGWMQSSMVVFMILPVFVDSLAPKFSFPRLSHARHEYEPHASSNLIGPMNFQI